VPADAETLVRTSRLGQETWRAFAPAGWTQREHDERIAFVREIVAHPRGVAVLASVAGEPPGTSRWCRATGTSRAARSWSPCSSARCISEPDSPTSLLPAAGAARENPSVDAGVRSRP
jgi:hypothetical protein